MSTISNSFLRQGHPEDGYAFSLRATARKMELRLNWTDGKDLHYNFVLFKCFLDLRIGCSWSFLGLEFP